LGKHLIVHSYKLSYTYITIMYRSQWESAIGKRSW